ncbi:type II toxin-antitoxin system Y4mF family antitoxin [Corynebacterium pyruviciproducens]|uniref:type II toxin-antitoxin system Y4mF family antitoxin n=1 Tax=Corynebacterium pyruviciproducens TaxID=598660 RepID=UPI0023F484B3|nr:type II toxin-antitoxin system Y4mF family antitoxin [Corynebacterium pyruviciproducens]MDK6564942.1 type II toxin-antitoxin system Y4mF family antitoxin [Corynebacterium pyruviciproducens]
MSIDNLGETVRKRRRELGINQLDLAERSGVSDRFIRDLEHGKTSLRLDKLVDLLTALGLELTIDELKQR